MKLARFSGKSPLGFNGRGGQAHWYLTPHLILLVSTVIYFIPYFVGYFRYIAPDGRMYDLAYSPQVGWAVALILLLLGVCAIISEKPSRHVYISPKSDVHIESLVLSSLIIVMGAFVFFSGKAAIASKQELLDQTGRWDYSFYLLASFGLIFSSIAGYRKHLTLFVVSLCGLLFVIYLGHRSSLVIAILGVAYVRFRDRPIPKLPLKYLVAGVALFFVVSIYKSIYVAIKMQQWDLVSHRLAAENIWASALVGMEQFTTFAHLDFVVSDNHRLDCSNAWLAPFTIVPFSDEFLGKFWDVEGCYYNSQIQPLYFSGYRGGVAANIWAEFFGYFGYWGFPVLISVLSGFYWSIEAIIRRLRSPVLISGMIVALINMSFYIQRKELLGAFISGKRAVIVAFCVFIVAQIVRAFNRKVSVG